MTKKQSRIQFGFSLISILFLFGFFLNNGFLSLVSKRISAYETQCPEGYTDEQCLEFFRQQSSDLQNQQNAINDELSQEKYSQLSLYDKINYISSQISSKQSLINSYELEIQTKNIETRILAKNIQLIQDNINTITQETDQLRDTIGKRIAISYKYNKLTPIEIILSADNLDNMLRKTKYLAESKKKDKAQLEQLNYNILTLKTEEEELALKKLEVQTKLNEIEAKKVEIYDQKTELDVQIAEQQILLAESKKKENEFNSKLADLRSIQNSIDAQATEIIMKNFRDGQLGQGSYVTRGQIIAFQGHTGCSYGAHLHYGFVTNGSYQWYANIDPFSSGYLSTSGNMVYSGAYAAPMDGAYVTQWWHQGMFLDMISLADGNQEHINYGSCWQNPSSVQCYYLNPGDLQCDPGTSGWFPLQGEGAYVYAANNGIIYYGVENWGGAKYAVIDHQNGVVTMYVHIR